MAGHSKWANIKHKKAAQDSKRGKIFTKLIREITVATKEGGAIIDDNPRLRLAVDKALSQNMPKSTIDRAIDRGSGNNDDANMSEVTYEGYGPGGVAILVETLTDNLNRTVAEVRTVFNKNGGNLGNNGSVAYLFTRRGEIFFEPGVDEEKLMEIALEAGAEDIESEDDGSFVVVTAPDQSLSKITFALKDAGFKPASSEVNMNPSTWAEVDHDTAAQIVKIVDLLEDLDDVQEVFTNVSFPDDFEG